MTAPAAPHDASFSQWLRQRRKSLDLTRKSLADCVGCSPKTIEKIEMGERRPSRQIAELLLSCLDVPQQERPDLLLAARGDQAINNGVAVVPAAAARTSHVPSNLPAPLTSFIGRIESLAAIRSLYFGSGARIVTLAGPPGIGKTRLALQAGASLLEDFPDGVYFVPLASLRDKGLIASSIAKELQVRETANRKLIDGLKSFLQEREMLLILDNFEQLVEGASLITELLAAAPGLKALATSRELLHVYGEHIYAVPPLGLPDFDTGRTSGARPGDEATALEQAMHYEAVKLFVERAKAAEHDIAISNDDVRTIIEICRGLDGLPLAIELAAARVGHLPVSDILSRLSSRLDLLDSGPRDRTTRQRTLRGAIEWSHDLLGDKEKRLFRRLSVFMGGCTIEAAATICADERPEHGDLAAVAHSLRDKSLIEGSTRAGSGRIRMLETIREYAWERLEENGELDSIQKNHAAYFLMLVETAEPMLSGPDQAVWLERLTAEHDNIRAAIDYLLQAEPEAALRLCGATTVFWFRRGHLTEGRAYLLSALKSGVSAPASVRGKGLNGAGVLAYAQGDYDEAKSLYSAGMAAHEEAGDRKAMARTLNNLGLIASNQSNYEAALMLYNDSLEIWKELGDRTSIALSLNNMMGVALAQGNYESARALAQESLDLRRVMGDVAGVASSLGNLGVAVFALGQPGDAVKLQVESLSIRREMGDRHGIAMCLVNLAELARYRGDNEEAERLSMESLDICRELGDKPGICNALFNLGHLAHGQGELERAEAYFGESLEMLQGAGDLRTMAQGLIGMAAVAGSRGHLQRATRLLGAVSAVLDGIGARLYPHELRDYQQIGTSVRSSMDEADWEVAWGEGTNMDLDDIGRYALSMLH